MTRIHAPRIHRAGIAAAIAAAALVGLTGCVTAGATVDAKASTSANQADAVTVSDAWVKAADEGMTAAFGTLRNDTGHDVRVVSVISPAAPDLQLHETVQDATGAMTMREVDGFVIPAHGSLQLEPGGDHIMFMSLPKPVTAGDDVELTLAFDDGSTTKFTAPAKDYSGANEHYEDGDEMGDMHGSTPSPTESGH